MWTRREVLGRGAAWTAAGLATFNPAGLGRLLEASAGAAGRQAADLARDETFLPPSQ
jgi:hypothetical protein